MTIDRGGYWSYPAFVVENNALHWVCLIFSTSVIPDKKRTALFRPKSMVILKSDSSVLIRFQNFRLGNDLFPEATWNDPIGMFPHRNLWGTTYREFEEAEIQLLSSYSDAGKLFLEKNSLPDEFVDNYLKLTHPALLPFLNVLAPIFVAALTPKMAEMALSAK